MLTIQPGISNITRNTSFGQTKGMVCYKDPESGVTVVIPDDKNSNDKYESSAKNLPVKYEEYDESEAIQENLKREEEDYEEDKNFWEEQKETFNELAEDTEVPKLLKKPMKYIAVAISSILGGMAMIWGSKKSMGAVETLASTKKAKSIKTTVSKKYNAILNSKIVKSIKKALNKQVQKFNNSKLGKSSFVQSIRKKYNALTQKLHKVKKEDVKNATANTMGVSGGITSGVTAAKEANKEEKQANNKDAE